MQEKMFTKILQQLDEIKGMLNGKPGKRDRIGRPTKKHIVVKFREDYPDSKKIQCVRKTGLSIKTVSKYWDL